MTSSTPEQFFIDSPAGLAVFRAVAGAVAALGPAETRVGRSQIAFRRRRGFAFVWRPGLYVRSDVPAVLSFALPYEVRSARIKQVVHPAATVWMHHAELHDPDQIDDEVRDWLAAAYAGAG